MFIGMAVMILLFSGIVIAFVLNQKRQLQFQNQMQLLEQEQQNRLIEAAIKSEEKERHRIAELLHDEIGAILSSSKLHFQGIVNDVLKERDRKLLEKGEQLLNEGIQKVRSISHNMHSNILKEFGLQEAIRHFAKTISQADLLSVQTDLDDTISFSNPESGIAIYRIIQELMNNTLKYAKPHLITIDSKRIENDIEFYITHNGHGIVQEEFEQLRYQKEGLGFKNILNRLIVMKGNIQFSYKHGHYLIEIKAPINVLV